MNIQYFKSAWGDIKNTPGWFGKLCLLALLNLIPIFGQVVTFAYLYGWAREIAWGTHEPMPAHIFSNEDGKFWRRGWFVLVLTFVFALIPQIVVSLGQYWQGFGFSYSFFGRQTVENPLLVGFGGLLAFVGWVGAVVMAVLAWIGNMRVSIYDRLSAGFQFGKIWKMLRHDTTGVLKIFGMELLVSLIVGLVLSIVAFILLFFVVAAGVAGLVNAGYSVESIQYMTDVQTARMVLQFFLSAGVIGLIAVLLGCFLGALASVLVNTLVIRALGYWTMQFDVARWGGQDDPLPFELVEKRQARWQTEQQSQAYAQPAPQPQPQPQTQPQPAPEPQPAPQPQPASEPEPELVEFQPEPIESQPAFPHSQGGADSNPQTDSAPLETQPTDSDAENPQA